MANRKEVYVMFNKDGQSLYNKTLGTWNDGTGNRDGSSVWTFSARKEASESPTIIKALEWLENLGHKDIVVELVEVEIDEKGRASIVNPDEDVEVLDVENAEIAEEITETNSDDAPVVLSEEDVNMEEEIDVESAIEEALLAEADNVLKNVA